MNFSFWMELMKVENVKMTLATRVTLGGVSAVWLAGAEEELRKLDRYVRLPSGKSASCRPGRMAYGQLLSETGACVDEVLLCCPAEGKRIVTGHGGTSCSQALLDFYADRSVRESAPEEVALFSTGTDNFIIREADVMLYQCQTDMQASLLLTARAGLDARIRAAYREFRNNNLPGLLDELLTDYEEAKRFLQTRRVCLAGAANAGKSSLFNCLLEHDRAFVHPEAGATRDAVEELIDLGGYAVQLADTAGMRESAQALEMEAQRRGRELLAKADAVALVIDASRAPAGEEIYFYRGLNEKYGGKIAVVLNKTDLPQVWKKEEAGKLFPGAESVEISCLHGGATEKLCPLLVKLLGGAWSGKALPFSERQALVLRALRP
jgi:tRNA modification GTPase